MKKYWNSLDWFDKKSLITSIGVILIFITPIISILFGILLTYLELDIPKGVVVAILIPICSFELLGFILVFMSESIMNIISFISKEG